MQIRSSLAVLLSTLVMTGCASMSADECATGDWHAIGFEDGSRGYTADHLGEHRKACAKHGITPDFAAYRAGHDEGLSEFCQPSRGFHLGERGGAYSGVCAAKREGAFLDAYHAGYQLFNLRTQVDSVNSEIRAREGELQENRKRVRDTEAALISDETTTEERVILIADLAELSERRGELEAEIDLLLADRARHEERLSSYQAALTQSGY